MSRDGISFGVPKAQLVTISSDEYESIKSTLEIISDPELMQQIEWNGIIVRSFTFICGSKLARIHKAGCHSVTLTGCGGRVKCRCHGGGRIKARGGK